MNNLQQNLQWVSILLLSLALWGINGLWSTVRYIESQLKSEAVLEADHSLKFIMDSTCYDQLKNSTDGVIRMKFNK